MEVEVGEESTVMPKEGGSGRVRGRFARRLGRERHKYMTITWVERSGRVEIFINTNTR